MYTRAFLSLAIGLIGVAASPCKPLTSASIVSSTALTSSVAEPTVSTSVESAVTETSTSAESLMTDTLASTAVDSTVTDLTTTALTATSADSTTLFTSETSAATTDFSSTETAADTTTADATTTTSDAPPVITNFAIVAGSGPSANKLKSDNSFGTPLYFGSSVTFPAQHYNIDAATGQIKAGAMSLCAWFTHSVTNYAYITACNSDNENLSLGVVYLTCQAPTEGSALQCSVPVLSCTQLGGGVQNCAATTDRLSHFTMQGDTGLLNIVADGFTGINQTPVDLVVDQAAVAAPTP
ncbi:hypothetical protein FPCIR_11852 [Fusarium pseudocircinatum]|uniref:Uncharacterized protein n=1 Tax=Fusarium pseudocircinatum TaxID=56676 RepID=A0A8H5NTR8_9HYPO|nr:hypothetical protein FPCIR_11852 [Fusarium pseudocircinatum]